MKGFLQRIDPHFKKYSFAIWGVYGDEGNYEIRGAWLWRGTEIPLEFVFITTIIVIERSPFL